MRDSSSKSVNSTVRVERWSSAKTSMSTSLPSNSACAHHQQSLTAKRDAKVSARAHYIRAVRAIKREVARLKLFEFVRSHPAGGGANERLAGAASATGADSTHNGSIIAAAGALPRERSAQLGRRGDADLEGSHSGCRRRSSQT